MGEGREGDWECGGCKNRNYAFRSFCNRCKQPRLLVDSKTPSDSKWLPRIGDWICTGCTNNNYASREKCKKCGQPKDVASIPAIAVHGASIPPYSHYPARIQGGLEQNFNFGAIGYAAAQQSLPLSFNWSVGGADKYGVQPVSTWSLGGNSSALPPAGPSVPKGWRNGDWLCNCGFHNYSSRAQCKKCNASPPALGTKRLASEDLGQDLDNKRLNVGQTNGLHQSHPAFDQLTRTIGDPVMGLYAPFSSVGGGVPQSMQFPQQATTPSLLGKGAKQWRDGDWMCVNCNNHNYASRAQCNRCKTQRGAVAQSVNAI